MSQHLKSRNVGFIKHFYFAWNAGVILIVAGFASLIHAMFPEVLTGYSERKTMALARLARIRQRKPKV